LTALGHTVTPAVRTSGGDIELSAKQVDAILFCQRFRGAGDEWMGELKATLTLTKRVCEWASEHMKQGSIVSMSSVAAVSVEEEQPVGYHVCKAGLNAMMEYYAGTLAPIRFNSIIPGLTVKPEARAFYDANPELERVYTDITPLGRMGTVEDIANLVDFLISPKSSYLTGQTITLDGGIGLRSHWALARKVHPTLRTVQVTQRKPAHV
jgi:NAD(P)-dependent dehydrogenase (short-subunit alcohol dehydrogenase family)